MNMNQESTSTPLQVFLSNLMAEKAAAVQQPLLIEDNARSHVDQQSQHALLNNSATSSNSFYKRQGAARWNDSFEVYENHQSPTSNLLLSPNSVVSLDRLVSPRRRESIVENAGSYCQLPMCQKESRIIPGTTAAFLASLPMDDGTDEC